MVSKKAKKSKKKFTQKKKPKKSARKSSKKSVKAKKKAGSKSGKAAPKKQVIGIVTHYFPHVEVAVVKLKRPLAVGDTVLIEGSTTNFKQRVESMQIDHVPLQKAKKGDEIGLQVKERVREHDLLLLPS